MTTAPAFPTLTKRNWVILTLQALQETVNPEDKLTIQQLDFTIKVLQSYDAIEASSQKANDLKLLAVDETTPETKASGNLNRFSELEKPVDLTSYAAEFSPLGSKYAALYPLCPTPAEATNIVTVIRGKIADGTVVLELLNKKHEWLRNFAIFAGSEKVAALDLEILTALAKWLGDIQAHAIFYTDQLGINTNAILRMTGAQRKPHAPLAHVAISAYLKAKISDHKNKFPGDCAKEKN